jgi:ABC-type nitrate/sulfonate/bicarbonate transport system substrate-binding protein
MPEWLNIGYEGDNMVERLEVILPKISDRQRAYLMIGESEYANMVDMIADGDVRYHVDLTAELVGKTGAAQAYIAIDGDDGSKWHSGVFRLNTGDLPAVNEDIAEHFPDAVERMREEISEHRDEMAEQTEVVADAANRAEEAAKKAAEEEAVSYGDIVS